MSFKSKKAQITVFIVLGLVLVLTIAIFLYVTKFTEIEQLKSETESPLLTDQQSLKNYVESCIKQVAQEPIILLAKQGGTLDPVNYRFYNGSKINYLCYAEDNLACVNSLLLRTDMEKELSYYLKLNLDYCLNFDYFEQQGYYVETNNINVSSTISDQKIYIDINYPISLSLDETDLSVSDYSIEFSSSLGYLHRIATFIINQENSNGYFDQVNFILNHTNILIKKDKPYPSIIYSLKTVNDNLEFKFAIQGIDTVSNPGEIYFGMPEDQYGCCYVQYDSTCYTNTPEQVCELKQGYYEPWPCECPIIETPETTLCNGDECNSCKNTYNYISDSFSNSRKLHGESWCVYDSIVGMGYDYVGSRHYLHYCVDGNEVVESGRDYREELCTEQLNTDGTTTAVLRPNRWQDCSKCETEECCDDSSLRDCYWRDWLTTENKCSPYVPPGFKFWDYNGLEVCNFATEMNECEGFSCPNKWIDDTAIYCYTMGDCGNYRNINDKLTKFGYFNTDFSDNVRDYVYLEDGNTEKGHDSVVALDLNTRKQEKLSTTAFEESADSFVTLISTVYDFVDSISYLSVSDFLNPFTPTPEIEIVDIAFCSVWQAPKGSKYCELCTTSSVHPCSEYKCKSLGQQCVYEEENGVPTCYAAPEDDIEIMIELDKSIITPGYSADEKSLTIHNTNHNGYEITPALIPHKLFTIGINTNKETVCKLQYTPSLEYINMPMFYFGDPIYSTSHNISLRTPPKIIIPEKIMDVLNISEITEIIDLLEKPEELVNTYEERFELVFKAYKLISGDSMAMIIEPFVDDILDFINLIGDIFPYYKELANTLLDRFESGGFYLFVECEDRAGNTNTEQFFIEITIDDPVNDTTPAIIITSQPENNSIIALDKDESLISIYLDEPAQCKFDYTNVDYEEMQYEFSCATSLYDLSPVAGGTYECNTELDTSNKSSTIFITCEDNPLQEANYEFKILHSSSNINTNASRFANVTEDNEIFVSSNMIREGNDIEFNINSTNVDFNLYIEELQYCVIEHNNLQVNLTNCQTINELDLGFYQCSAEIELEKINQSDLIFELSFINSTGTNAKNVLVNNDSIEINITTISSGEIFTDLTEFDLYFNFNGPYLCEDMNCDENTCVGNLELLNNTNLSFSCIENNDYIDIEKTDQGYLYNYNIDCYDLETKQQNVNEVPYEYILRKSEPFEITNAVPSDNQETSNSPVITVTTTESESISCSYNKDYSLGMLKMIPLSSNVFQARLSELPEGFNKYYIKCNDEYGNIDSTEIEFYVVE